MSIENKKKCFGKYQADNEECQMCLDATECEKKPSCFQDYDSNKEFCSKICRHKEDCINFKKQNG